MTSPYLSDRVLRSAHATAAKIARFANFQSGWFYGRGNMPASTTIETAFAYLFLLSQNGVETDAFIGAGGEVAVTAYMRDHYVSVGIEPSGLGTLLHQKGEVDVVDNEGLSHPDLIKQLFNVLTEIKNECVTSGSSTRQPMIGGAVNFITMPSDQRVETPEFQSLNVIAPWPLPDQSANTFASSTQNSVVNRRSFGFSKAA